MLGCPHIPPTSSLRLGDDPWGCSAAPPKPPAAPRGGGSEPHPHRVEPRPGRCAGRRLPLAARGRLEPPRARCVPPQGLGHLGGRLPGTVPKRSGEPEGGPALGTPLAAVGDRLGLGAARLLGFPSSPFSSSQFHPSIRSGRYWVNIYEGSEGKADSEQILDGSGVWPPVEVQLR